MPNKTSRSENGSIGSSLVLDNQRLFGFLSRSHGWRIRLLPHEYAFSLFLALTSVRLVAGVGLASPLSLAFLGFLLASAFVITWSGPEPAPWRWRVRLLLYPALMGLSFYMVPSVIAALHVPRADALLVKWDSVWLGKNINLAIQGWEPPLLTDLLMMSYVFFFYYLVAGPAYYCIRDLPRFRQCFAGLFVVYALGLDYPAGETGLGLCQQRCGCVSQHPCCRLAVLAGLRSMVLSPPFLVDTPSLRRPVDFNRLLAISLLCRCGRRCCHRRRRSLGG
jgi:hypothetical protein